MRKSLLVLLLFALPAGAAPAGHVPTTAREAAEMLVSKGLMKGYPGGSLGGRRAITRYETAELMDRVQRYLEGQLQDLAPRSQLAPLKSDAQAIGQGLEDLGGRTGKVDSSLENQNQRLDEK